MDALINDLSALARVIALISELQDTDSDGIRDMMQAARPALDFALGLTADNLKSVYTNP